MQGLGLFTLEELHYSPQGVLLTRGPGSYKIPAFGDIPTNLTVSLLRDAPNDKAIFSSKVQPSAGVCNPSMWTHVCLLRPWASRPSFWLRPSSTPSKTPSPPPGESPVCRDPSGWTVQLLLRGSATPAWTRSHSR